MPAMSGRERDTSEEMARSCLKRCKKFIAVLKDHPDAKPFKQPVDPVKDKAPDYYKVVQQPMDLRTITEKLNAGRYWTPFEVDADVRLMVDNCLAYNAASPFYCGKARALWDAWQSLFWKDDAISMQWAQATSVLYSEVPEQDLYWPQQPADVAAMQLQLEAVGQEIVRASGWLEQPLTISCGGRSARLLGGHHSSPAAVWTACECATCHELPLSPNDGGRMMTLQELHDHCTGAPPDAPALDNQQLMEAFQVSTSGDAAPPLGPTLLQHLKVRSVQLGAADLIGQDVWVYWPGGAAPSWPPPEPPQGGSWHAARIVCFDDRTSEHLLRYQNPQGPKARWLPCFRAYLPITFHHFGTQPPAAAELPTLLSCGPT